MRILAGGNILTMAGSNAEAVAFDASGIVAVGSRDEVLAKASARGGASAPRVEELADRCLVPGFIDAHHHMSLAVFYEGCRDLGGARSIGEILEAVAEVARHTEPGRWVLAFNYDEARLQERRHPTRAELDDAAPAHPVCLLHYSGHEVAASSKALALAGIDETTPDPYAGVMGRDAKGRLDGHLIELAISKVEGLARADRAVMDAAGWISRLEQYQERLFAAGITGIVDAMVPSMFEALYRQAHDEGRLRVPVAMLPGSAAGLLSPPVDRIETGSRTGEGDDMLRTGPLKLVFDGANRCAVCLSFAQAFATGARTVGSALATLSLTGWQAMRASAPTLARDLSLRTGLLCYPPEKARDIVTRAHNAGLGVAIHANGNAAIEQALDALTHLRDVSGARGRNGWPLRIEHASFLPPALAAKIADAEVAVVAQPPFLLLPAVEHATIPTGLRYVALRALVKAGVSVGASSDAPVTTFDVLEGIRAAVTRRLPSGRVLHPDEAIDVESALAMYTRGAAAASGWLDRKGTIEAGKRADLVVLRGDLDSLRSGSGEVLVDETIVGGTTRYRRAVR
jgi:predicted amidohydrolase YtcJ